MLFVVSFTQLVTAVSAGEVSLAVAVTDIQYANSALQDANGLRRDAVTRMPPMQGSEGCHSSEDPQFLDINIQQEGEMAAVSIQHN